MLLVETKSGENGLARRLGCLLRGSGKDAGYVVKYEEARGDRDSLLVLCLHNACYYHGRSGPIHWYLRDLEGRKITIPLALMVLVTHSFFLRYYLSLIFLQRH